MQINRRSFLMGSAGVATGLAFGAGSAIPALAEDANLRAMWWGSNDRAKRTLEVSKLYQGKTPGVSIVGESLSGDGYWTKLATQMAGRSIADVFQLEPGTISDYSKRGACLPLDEFVPSTLKVDAFGKDMLKLTTIDEKLYGIGLGLNSFALFFDQTAFEKAAFRCRRLISPGMNMPSWRSN
jgi:multiple sugar transport system substrate-binding protein